ncbi:IS66 family transposase [Nonomuraea guangzhouensis]|uniref:Transposase n=1 Tax=Nonomuraea guangzhouensis TaxID=1291555 RepID=A0ABW4GY40_9ACTN|nr:transposase [Nonomuraea guangzhouensis]
MLLNAPASTGFVGGLVKRVSSRLATFESALKNALRAALVLHHNETPARVAADNGDRLLYVSTARADRLVWFGAADHRGHDALDRVRDSARRPQHLVRDDYTVYAKYDKDLAAVQLWSARVSRVISPVWTRQRVSSRAGSRSSSACVQDPHESGQVGDDGNGQGTHTAYPAVPHREQPATNQRQYDI